MFETTSRHQMFGSKSQAHRKIGAISGNILTLTDVFAWDNLKNTFNEIQYTEISIDHLEMFALDRCILWLVPTARKKQSSPQPVKMRDVLWLVLEVLETCSGWWYTYPFWKIWVLQLGVLFPIYGNIIHSCSSHHQPVLIMLKWDQDMDSTKMTILDFSLGFHGASNISNGTSSSQPRDEIEEHVIFWLLRGSGCFNGTVDGKLLSAVSFARFFFSRTCHISLVSLKHESNNLMLLAGWRRRLVKRILLDLVGTVCTNLLVM